jgi:hypothetical protein
MTDWVVFYDDGSTFSSDDGGPEDAPKDGVLVVVVSDIATGRTMWHSADYYCWHKEGEWVPHNQRGLDRYLSLDDEPGIYLAGYSVPNATWQKIYRQALDDDRMPPKTAWRSDEPDNYAPAAEKAAMEKEWEQTAAKKPRKGK